jgi:hypothetical protein
VGCSTTSDSAAGRSRINGTTPGRLAVPSFVTCNRNEVTAYSGEVIAYKSSPATSVLRIRTDAGTTEEVKVTRPSESYFVMGSKFADADWKKIEVKNGRLRPHMRAIAWVCGGGATFIDWRVGEKTPTGDYRAATGSSTYGVMSKLRTYI